MAKEGDGSLGWLRRRNRERVISVLRERGQMSQAQIARATGLSRTTVSSLVAGLREARLVTISGAATREGRGGRPSVQLALDDSQAAVIGIDFGHSKIQVALADPGHDIKAERTVMFDVDHRAREALDKAVTMADEVMRAAAVDRGDIVGVGLGIPGPVDQSRGTVGSATILPGWVGLRIREEIEERLRLRVAIDNDANLGALAEMIWGEGRGFSSFAYIKASTGIGAGIVIERRLLHGATGTAGELGHTTLDEAGALCYCGNRGCLETLASAPAIAKLVSQSKGQNLAIGKIIEYALEGDVSCRRAISDAGREIGVAVAGLCNIVNPERVIFGGSLSRAGDLLLDPVRASIRRCAVLAAADRLEVVPAAFFERAELYGSLALALYAADRADLVSAQSRS